MSFGFRDKDRPSLRDRLRGKSSDQIVEELRRKLDKEKEMFFDRVPNPPSFRRAGFPFDDDGLRARGRPDFRQRLEDLAQQHPEFADSLRPWYDQEQQEQREQQKQPSHPPPQQQAGGDMGWGFRSRTGSNTSQPQSPHPQAQPHAQPQPDAQPQNQESAKEQPQQPGPGLAHHGLRNTVDLGEAQAQAQGADMEDADRGKRAQSAPPAPDQAAPKRFTSWLEINPQPAANQDPAAAKPPSGSKPQSQPQPQAAKASGSSGNVRQIPIFVEGRDEPVLARDDVDSSSASFGQGFTHHPPPHSHQMPPHPSRTPFGHQGFSRTNMGFPSFHGRDPHEQEAPAHKRPFAQQQSPQPPTRQQQPQQQQQPHPQQQQPPRQQQQQPRQATPPQQPPPQQQQPQPQPPLQQTKPKDALEKVRDVMVEVESLSKQVDEFVGTRTDKHYMFLDEMLTRELIKLDVIETEGRDDVRTARKETIRAIQQCISKLEAKSGAASTPSTESMDVDKSSASTETMDVDSQSAASSQTDVKTEGKQSEPAPPAPPAQDMDTTPAEEATAVPAPSAEPADAAPQAESVPAPEPAAADTPAAPSPAADGTDKPPA